MTDHLRDLLRSIDPAPEQRPYDDVRAEQVVGAILAIPLMVETETATRPNRIRWVALAAAAVLAAVVIVVPGMVDRPAMPAAPVEPALGEVAAVERWGALLTPVQEASLSPAQWQTVAAAVTRTTQQCLDRFEDGGQAWPYEVGAWGEPGPGTSFGPWNLAAFDEASTRPASPAPDSRKTRERTPQELRNEEILRGESQRGGPASTIRDRSGQVVPVGGCEGEAARIVGIPRGMGMETFLAIESRGMVATLKDSRYVAVDKAWAACMVRAGLHVTAHADLTRLIATRSPHEMVSAKRQALVCSQEVNYFGTAWAVASAYQRVLIEQDRPEVDRASAEIKAWYERAAAIVR